jgi:hypothetical protein
LGVLAVFALHGPPSRFFAFQPPFFADVANVTRMGRHAAPPPGDLHIDLRRTPHDGGFDALADGVGTLV